MKKIIKRDLTVRDFDRERIVTAINASFLDVEFKENNEISNKIADEIELIDKDEFHVNDIQDLIENKLIDNGYLEVAKSFIKYRNKRDIQRKNNNVGEYKLLDDEFFSKYKHMKSPLNQLGSFVFYRTYSRWIPDLKRRETWAEMVRRAVEYNCSIIKTPKEEAQELFDNIINLRQMLSGRCNWIGGTEVSKTHPIANFNCAFRVMDNFEGFCDLFYLLMLGTGFGIRILKEDVVKFPKVRTNIKLVNEEYNALPKDLREDNTNLEFTNDIVRIVVGDSKEGWTQALRYYFEIFYKNDYRNIKTIIINYDNVRPYGERLKKFGGFASGHTAILNMFNKIQRVIANVKNNKLKPIDCLDICTIIGENVVVGGVRRSSQIALVDSDDNECIKAKEGLYKLVDGKYEMDTNISHRAMSNNSIIYYNKPNREQLHKHLEELRYSGEPGFINAESASHRRSDFKGLNPCSEILLDSCGLCNLTTINVLRFVKDGKLDRDSLLNAQRLSSRAGYRMTFLELELPEWNTIQQRDRLVGCSLTGWKDMVDAAGLTKDEEVQLLKDLRETAHLEIKKLAKENGTPESLLSTTIKPEGTLSQVCGCVSPGLHYSHSPYFVRRVRISSGDPLCKVVEELGYPVYAENGQDWDTCKTKVVEFPVKTPARVTKYDVSAIEQLETYKMFMENYVDHNASITVTVRDNEWEEVEEWVWNNWDSVVGISFLSLCDSYYPLLPYEAISKEEYEERVKNMKEFIPSLISKYEIEETDFDLGNESCKDGNCSVR